MQGVVYSGANQSLLSCQSRCCMMVKAYMTSYKMPCIIIRGNNVYGPHQFSEKMIPKFTLLASRGAPLPIHGDGGATGSYLYVEDVAEAFEPILTKGKIGETYNIGTQKERTVLDVAGDIARALDLPPTKITHVLDRVCNDQRYFICDKKLAFLGWEAKTSWRDGLSKSITCCMGNVTQLRKTRKLLRSLLSKLIHDRKRRWSLWVMSRTRSRSSTPPRCPRTTPWSLSGKGSAVTSRRRSAGQRRSVAFTQKYRSLKSLEHESDLQEREMTEFRRPRSQRQ